VGIYGGSVSEAEKEEEGEEEELDVVKVGVGGGGGDFWRVFERLMVRRAQCGVVIEVHVSRLILLVAHRILLVAHRRPTGVGPRARGRVVRGVRVM
jgi:hypothetical protein